MFYGAKLLPGQSVQPKPEDGGHVLHISHVCLHNPKDNDRTYVQLSDGKAEYSVCVLTKDKCESATVDVFVGTFEGIRIKTSGGKNEVHLVGYYEPDDENDMGDETGSDLSESELAGADLSNEEDISEDEDVARMRKLKIQGKMHPKITDVTENGDAEESDENSEDEENDESEVEEGKKPQDSHKRKLNGMPQQKQTPAKKQKASAGQANAKPTATTKDIETFLKSLGDYLKAHGKTQIAQLGNKVKKPAGISEKLTKFLKDRPNVFKMENGNVTLCA